MDRATGQYALSAPHDSGAQSARGPQRKLLAASPPVVAEFSPAPSIPVFTQQLVCFVSATRNPQVLQDERLAENSDRLGGILRDRLAAIPSKMVKSVRGGTGQESIGSCGTDVSPNGSPGSIASPQRRPIKPHPVPPFVSTAPPHRLLPVGPRQGPAGRAGHRRISRRVRLRRVHAAEGQRTAGQTHTGAPEGSASTQHLGADAQLGCGLGSRHALCCEVSRRNPGLHALPCVVTAEEHHSLRAAAGNDGAAA